MSSWFTKSANTSETATRESPQPFVLTCPCGESLQGLRKPTHQRVICKGCNRPLFILPQDVYPAARRSASQRDAMAEPISVRTLVEDSSESDEIDFNTIDLAEENDLAEKVRPRKKTGKPSTREESADDSNAPLPSLADLRKRIRDAEKPKRPPKVAAAEPEKSKVVEQLGKSLGGVGEKAVKEFVGFWSAFRILAVLVAVVILFTSVWMLRQSSLATAAKVAKVESEAGLAAIEKTDWVEAHRHLQLAAAALDRLGRTDPEAQNIRMYAKEIQAQFRLCDLTLAELLETARVELATRTSKTDKKDKLASAYYGNWFILEGLVSDVTPDKQRKREFALQLPLNPMGDSAKVTIRTDFAALEKLVPGGGNAPFILAGALTDLRRDDESGWVITLDPKTGFPWTHLDTYRAAGFDFSPLRSQSTVEGELKAQAQAMGILP